MLYEAASLGMMSQIRRQLDNIEQMDAKICPLRQEGAGAGASL